MSSADKYSSPEGEASGPVESTPDVIAEEAPSEGLAATGLADSEQTAVATAPEETPAPDPHRRARRRPCFHCGAMTPVPVLERTGELCWRCYRPLGYLIVKNLLVVAVVLGGAAAVLVGWRLYRSEREVEPAAEVTTDENSQREFTTEEKLALLRRHFLGRELMQDLCAEKQISPAEFRRWREQFFQAGEAAFQHDEDKDPNAVERRIGVIEQKIQMAAKVLGELRDNLTQLKRESGQYEISPTQRFILDAGPPPK